MKREKAVWEKHQERIAREDARMPKPIRDVLSPPSRPASTALARSARSEQLSSLHGFRAILTRAWTSGGTLLAVGRELVRLGVIEDPGPLDAASMPAAKLEAALLKFEGQTRQIIAQVLTGSEDIRVELLNPERPNFVVWNGAPEDAGPVTMGGSATAMRATVERNVEVVRGAPRPARLFTPALLKAKPEALRLEGAPMNSVRE